MLDKRTSRSILISAALLSLSIGTLACPEVAENVAQKQETPAKAVGAQVVLAPLPAPPERPSAEPVEPPEPSPVPPGFPPEDMFSSHDEACLKTVMSWGIEDPIEERAVVNWCEHRSYHSSRNGIVVSRVDGTQIHDRDRPTAWMFYQRQVLRERLNPETCPYHRVNRHIPHPPECKKMARDWPFGDVRLPDRIKNQWLSHPHDMERFGARGPHDWNANAYNHLPGCWDPAQLERFDVGIYVTVAAAVAICEEHGCRSKWDIKKHWGRRG